MFDMCKKHALAVACLVSSFTMSNVSNALPDTAVENTVNFSTDVIYQIITDRFRDGDTSNNPTGAIYSQGCSNLRRYCGGDWQGVIDRIEDGYLTDMGITALWISPPVEAIFALVGNDANASASYHGFWARDYKRSNPFFGSLDDFRNLISVAHANNIKVVIDFAPNHTSPASIDEPSFAENGRLFDDGVLVGGYTNDVADLFHQNGGTDFSTLEDGIYRNLFDLADFNQQNPIVDDYFADAIKLWLDLGVDGLRVDAVRHMPLGWQQRWMDEIYDHRAVFSFGEWFLGANQVDLDNHEFANESGMSLLDFRFGQMTREVLRNNNASMVDLHAMIVDTGNAYNEVIDQVTFIDNHDLERFHFDGADTRRTDQALAFTLTARGVPGIYYGTEQYLTGGTDPDNRRFMPSFNRNTTAYQLISRLAPLRKVNRALAYGSTQERWLNDDIYVYERVFGDNVVLVAINKGNTSTTLNGLFTTLPAGSYGDVLDGLLNGETINVASSGAVTPFSLDGGEVGVWQFTAASSSTPNVGHVGPMMGKTGSTITIDGQGFGTVADTVSIGTANANIVSWEDTQIVVTVPDAAALPAGQYDVTVTRGGVTSNAYDSFEVLTTSPSPSNRTGSSVRFIVNNAFTQPGQNVYLIGNIPELGQWDPANAIGPIFNTVITGFPTWYMDVFVPSCTEIEFKFQFQDGGLPSPIWEFGDNHVVTTPCDGNVGTVIVDGRFF